MEDDIRDELKKVLHEMREVPEFLNEHAVSDLTGRKLSTLRHDRSKKNGIPYVKIGRQVRYELSDVIAFMRANKVHTQHTGKISSEES